MLKVIARRLIAAVPTMVGVLIVAFLLIEIMPGDPARIMAGQDATPEAIELLRERLGMNHPLPQRFINFVTDVVSGDFGQSAGTGAAVISRIQQALPVTASLGLVALAIALPCGLLGGGIAGARPGGVFDRFVSTSTSVALAIPSFLAGLVLVVFFAVNRSWFPPLGYSPLADGVWPWLHHLILPGVALSTVSMAELARQTRGAVVDTLEQDHIRAARAKGLSDRLIFGKHVAKNAAVPVITVLGLQVVRVLGGTVVVEQIFGLHGYGTLAVNAVLTRDLFLIRGLVIVTAIVVLLANLIVDLSYGLLNPRARVDA